MICKPTALADGTLLENAPGSHFRFTTESGERITVASCSASGQRVILSTAHVAQMVRDGHDPFTILNGPRVCRDLLDTLPPGTTLQDFKDSLSLPYPPTDCATDCIRARMAYRAEIEDVTEPFNPTWQEAYLVTLPHKRGGRIDDPVSTELHHQLTHAAAHPYPVPARRCLAPRRPQLAFLILPTWLTDMLPRGWHAYADAILQLGMMANPVHIERFYAATELPRRAATPDLRPLIRQNVQIRVAGTTIAAARAWCEALRPGSPVDGLTTLFMLGLGLPNGTTGHLNSPIEWHPKWLARAREAREEDALGVNAQSLILNTRHLTLIRATVLAHVVPAALTPAERLAQKRLTVLGIERVLETAYALPRRRWVFTSGADRQLHRSERLLSAASVDPSLFLKELVVNALGALGERSWIETAAASAPAGNYADYFVSPSVVEQYQITLKQFIEKYRALMVKQFIHNFVSREYSDEWAVRSPYYELLPAYGGGITNLATLHTHRDYLCERRSQRWERRSNEHP